MMDQLCKFCIILHIALVSQAQWVYDRYSTFRRRAMIYGKGMLEDLNQRAIRYGQMDHFFDTQPAYDSNGEMIVTDFCYCDHFVCRYCGRPMEHDKHHTCDFYGERVECGCAMCRSCNGFTCQDPINRAI